MDCNNCKEAIPVPMSMCIDSSERKKYCSLLKLKNHSTINSIIPSEGCRKDCPKNEL